MAYPKWTLGFVPYTRCELPGWGAMLKAIGVLDDSARWADAPTRTVRGKLHGYRMTLRLSDWSERHTFFLGRYYELGTQCAIQHMVRPGDCFLDIGANIGMITLLAAHCVGPNGSVHAVEPNPENVERIHAALTDNAITHVSVHPVGLADAPGRLRLHLLPGTHTGTGTFTNVPESEAQVTSIDVEVLPGDDLALDVGDTPLFIKIDVEGFECHVIDGLARTLETRRPAMVTECVKWHLERAGHSLDALFARMHDRGYRGYVIQTKRRALRHRLDLQPLGKQTGDQFFGRYRTADVLWVHPDSVFQARLTP